MQENTDKNLGKESEDIINECWSSPRYNPRSSRSNPACARSNYYFLQNFPPARPHHVYRDLSGKTEQPLHLGLTEAGMGMKGQIWSAASLGILLYDGIGDTIRISLTPRPGGDRREEVYACCEVLQALVCALFLRASPPARLRPHHQHYFQELAERTQAYIREMMPTWKTQYDGVETMTSPSWAASSTAPVNPKPPTSHQPSRHRRSPRCPVYIDGKKECHLEGNLRRTSHRLQILVDNYISTNTPANTPL